MEQLLCRSLFYDLSVFHNDQMIADVLQDCQVVADEQQRQFA